MKFKELTKYGLFEIKIKKISLIFIFRLCEHRFEPTIQVQEKNNKCIFKTKL